MALRFMGLLLGVPWAVAEISVPDCATAGHSYVDPSVTALNGGEPADAKACQTTCADTVGCSVFTYYTDSKGCWMMTALAKIRTPVLPSDQFAISGPRVCPGEDTTTTTTTTTISNTTTTSAIPAVPVNKEGMVTFAPGFEISPTGIRPVGLGAGPPEELERSADEVSAFGYTVKINATDFGLPESVLGVDTIAGYSWIWWVLATILVVMLCSCCWCCCCCCNARKRRSRASVLQAEASAEPLQREATGVSEVPERTAERMPLVIKDAGLTHPRLNVPQLPMPQLQVPQLVPVPASQANSFDLQPRSPSTGYWSPGHQQFARAPLSPTAMYP
mmetsp:Transcript_22257/g.51508  ORF Transcript_22257/g.51508 Transcript_22257/m.51508 type:complete len:332 (-) Transcript_22257:113-1108(-)